MIELLTDKLCSKRTRMAVRCRKRRREQPIRADMLA
jgi:hypothetical protein